VSRHHQNNIRLLALLLLALTGFACSQPKKPARSATAKSPAGSIRPPARATTPPASASHAAPSPTHHQGQQQLSLHVVSVHDGDTLRGLDDAKTQHKIRLHGIDAPETDQPFGQASKQALSSKVFGKDVVVVVKDTDRYGRRVGHIFVDGRDVNHEMLQDGMAWHYTKYDNGSAFRQAEQSARAAKRGLWASKDAVAPWDWRKGEKDRK
jgi:endonuclease YncB( thermonuclease family)